MPRIPLTQLMRTAVLESTRPAPISQEGDSWPWELNTDHAMHGTWTHHEAGRCAYCNQISTSGDCLNQACSHYEHRIDGFEGPMINSWYPLGHSDEDFDYESAAIALVDIPLIVVRVEDQWGLALTGGGMDMTWYIIEAFTTLGYLPPFDHCLPPSMAGMKLDTKTKYLLGACRRTCRAVADSAKYRLRAIGHTQDFIVKQQERAATAAERVGFGD